MMAADDIKVLEGKCMCGSVHFSIEVPKSSLPLEVFLCHCSVCRYGTGAPCIFHTLLAPGITPKFISPSSEKNLVKYQPKGFSCTYESCSTCGCHIAGVGLEREDWVISTSIFLEYGPDILQTARHGYSNSAGDGGIAKCLAQIGGRKLTDWNPPDDDPRAKVVVPEPEVGADGEDRLRAKCLCGGVDFTIRRPTDEVYKDKFWSSFVSPIDKTKWMATWDCCDDCRLVNGTNIIGWTFLPLSLCEPEIKPDLNIGTAKTYSSSDGVLRSFCGVCGATVFYFHTDRKPAEGREVVDLATGILRAPEGSMAENWLTWRSRLAWVESGKAYDKEFTEALEEGMKTLVVSKVGRELTMNIG